MEIKIGDLVRVSGVAPKIYLSCCGGLYVAFAGVVIDIEGDHALIKSSVHIKPTAELAIPTKYLVKVDAEAKEPKFKVGDWVKISETPNSQLNGRVGAISQIDKEGYKISFNDGFFTVVSEEDLTLADEPTEAEKNANEELQEEYARFMSGRMPILSADRIEREHILRRMRVISQDDFLKEINPAEHEVNPKSRYIPKIMFNTEFWVKYEADLAKELAIAYGKRGKSPLDAVAVAKEITKRLKQK